jgi:hypothetical protein
VERTGSARASRPSRQALLRELDAAPGSSTGIALPSDNRFTHAMTLVGIGA